MIYVIAEFVLAGYFMYWSPVWSLANKIETDRTALARISSDIKLHFGR